VKKVNRIKEGGEMYAVYDYDTESNKTETVTKDFILVARFNMEITSVKNNFNFFNAAYATSCAKKHFNYLDEESFILNIDSAFIFNNDTIEPSNNLLKLSGFDEKFFVYDGMVNIHFTQDFLNHSVFQHGKYRSNLNGKTTDNINLNCSGEIQFNL
jgi:hypothetical protein